MTDHARVRMNYIVVVGGAAGSVVAGELSRPEWDVLLVESGGRRLSFRRSATQASGFYMSAARSTGACRLRRFRNSTIASSIWRSATLLGGGSSINAMVWSRGMGSRLRQLGKQWRRRLELPGRAADVQEPGRLGRGR